MTTCSGKPLLAGGLLGARQLGAWGWVDWGQLVGGMLGGRQQAEGLGV